MRALRWSRNTARGRTKSRISLGAFGLADVEVDLAAGEGRSHRAGAVERDDAHRVRTEAERVEQRHRRDVADRAEIDAAC